MEWLLQNWIWILVGVAFVALHMFGHGGHGGHGGHRGDRSDGRSTDHGSAERRDADASSAHRH
ncbi:MULTISPECIES: DUF2933 domain-containing protein [Novosphingobium]|uniref:DUF2933 domain-containing protein n=1 Tax=Novosphingobium TaxID=165696 RepID=UPI0009FEA8B0